MDAVGSGAVATARPGVRRLDGTECVRAPVRMKLPAQRRRRADVWLRAGPVGEQFKPSKPARGLADYADWLAPLTGRLPGTGRRVLLADRDYDATASVDRTCSRRRAHDNPDQVAVVEDQTVDRPGVDVDSTIARLFGQPAGDRGRVGSTTQWKRADDGDLDLITVCGPHRGHIAFGHTAVENTAR